MPDDTSLCKLHPWFQSLSVVHVFLFLWRGWWVQEVDQIWLRWFSRSSRRTLDHSGRDPPSADDNDPWLFSSQVSASSSPNNSWSSPSFLLYHNLVLLVCFQQKLHETNIQNIKSCKAIHGSGQRAGKSSVRALQKSRSQMKHQGGNSCIYAIPCPIVLQMGGGCSKNCVRTTWTYCKRIESNENVLQTFRMVKKCVAKSFKTFYLIFNVFGRNRNIIIRSSWACLQTGWMSYKRTQVVCTHTALDSWLHHIVI